MQPAFNNALYIEKQTKHIKERISQFGDKLYLEFGGKIFDDYHAARVLPGFAPDNKIKLLLEFKEICEILFCINAADIEKNKIRADLGITYDLEILRLIDSIRGLGLLVNNIVITQYSGQHAADVFRSKLEKRGINTYIHYPIPGYPGNVDLIVSDEGYGKNEFVETTRQLVVVTAPGPCSGKMATCLSQLYHEHKRGVQAGYAKFDTFPIWNLPLKHPVNLAYEAATADLKDVNMIDPYHLEAYNIRTVNYNRDIEVFPVVKTILKKILGKNVYLSPTDMGVNMAGYAIEDDEKVRTAANEEIIRRYFKIRCDFIQGLVDAGTVEKIELIMNQADLKPSERSVVQAAIKKAQCKNAPAMALQLPSGEIVTGRNTNLMTAAASCTLNALKMLSGLDDALLLIAPVVLEPILQLKKDIYGTDKPLLSLEEVLISLSISAVTNTMADITLKNLHKLSGCEAHSTVILSPSDDIVCKKLGYNLTCEPAFASDDLYDGK